MTGVAVFQKAALAKISPDTKKLWTRVEHVQQRYIERLRRAEALLNQELREAVGVEAGEPTVSPVVENVPNTQAS